jgi:small subunit ribosomal protein S1
VINLSIKAREASEERASVKAHKRQETEAMPSTTIGDLIRAQMDSTDR